MEPWDKIMIVGIFCRPAEWTMIHQGFLECGYIAYEEEVFMNVRAGNVCFWLLLLASLVTTGACASIQRLYHGYVMQGQIVDKTDNEVVLCIGTKEGAGVGQELTVYEVRNVPIEGNPKAVRYQRIPVGRIRITEIIDDHFARARIVEGRADKYHIAEAGGPTPTPFGRPQSMSRVSGRLTGGQAVTAT